MKMLLLLLCLLCLFVSFVCFILCGIDKRAAKRGMRRIPEKRLLLLALFGGGLGLWLGMLFFRHKTRHLRFLFFAPLAALSQLLGLFLLAGAAFELLP